MNQLTLCSHGPLHGDISVPGDKSISHRALLLGALGDGTSRVHGFLPSNDCLATCRCVQGLGISVDSTEPTTQIVHGRGLHELSAPTAPLDCVRSGTTMRLLTGMLAGLSFESTLVGEPQLMGRPMARVVTPLQQMGAQIDNTDGHAPLMIRGNRLQGTRHELSVASAQVKSALLLAGLYATGATTVVQPGPSRDHTERMLIAMGVKMEIDGLTVTISPGNRLMPLEFTVPGDLSSAAFPIAAAILVPGSTVTIRNVGVNPTRTGFLDVLTEMGGKVAVIERHKQAGEPVADIRVRASSLMGVKVGGDTAVRMIDEFPVLAVAATQAEGKTVVRDAAELRVKETDRIFTIVGELSKLGAQIEDRDDGFVVHGPTKLVGDTVNSHGDHRVAMALAVAGLIAQGKVVIQNAECMDDSFPGFVELMRSMGAPYD